MNKQVFMRLRAVQRVGLPEDFDHYTYKCINDCLNLTDTDVIIHFGNHHGKYQLTDDIVSSQFDTVQWSIRLVRCS